ncbi:hypothetical protein NA8A_17905 [Nitratireductor indicus C115]|uniref:Uncharacterized protein n=1 Tax=Nitratireductor indicus C115 TaxID=1231190 RepID=K2N0Q4_9HYPH|nr:hypothetical protein [Nitratireductor indicus]EKF41068.1 hypothetical protein NA8A_17905 [Nitratireductor indicus C115]SFQ74159.1 hypothetical protein SAMN05216176_112100 [Nitratireductor indicus]
MGKTIRSLWQHHRLLFIAFCIALLITLLLALRTVAFYAYWSTHRAVPIEDWMTIGYVARSWEVEPDALRRSLGLDDQTRDRRSIARLAAERGVPAGVLLEDVRKAVDRLRETPEGKGKTP